MSFYVSTKILDWLIFLKIYDVCSYCEHTTEQYHSVVLILWLLSDLKLSIKWLKVLSIRKNILSSVDEILLMKLFPCSTVTIWWHCWKNPNGILYLQR